MPGSTKEEDRAKESCFKNSIKYTVSLSLVPSSHTSTLVRVQTYPALPCAERSAPLAGRAQGRFCSH